MKIIWKEPASFAKQGLQADKQNFARAAARTLGQTTNIRIISLSNSVDDKEGNVLFNKKEADASAADILQIKLRWPFTTLMRQSSPFRLTLEIALTLLGRPSSKKPGSVNFFV